MRERERVNGIEDQVKKWYDVREWENEQKSSKVNLIFHSLPNENFNMT